jgi:hypothetical protein
MLYFMLALDAKFEYIATESICGVALETVKQWDD